jgi:hypothetical protein
MSDYGDTRRSIVAWLEAEAVDRAPARLIEASRERVRTTPQRAGWWPARRVSGMHTFAKVAVAAAAVVVAAFGVVGMMQRTGPTIGPGGLSQSPTPQPSAAVPSNTAAPSSAVDDPALDGVVESQWPQTTDEAVRHAQERADAGDPAYTWQLDEQEVIDRFLHDVVGWDEFIQDLHALRYGFGVVYIKCAPGEANPLYPTADEFAPGAERCAPTMDGLRHESVRLELQQPTEENPNGIWVVHDWAMTEPLTEVDPRVAETEVTAQLEEWLAARIAGDGAEGKVDLEDEKGDGKCRKERALCRIEEVPLLYATTSGAPFERYEIERVGGPRWPYAEMDFRIRLFADDGATVVEQPISWILDGPPQDPNVALEFRSTVAEMTENGRPVAVTRLFFNGELVVSAARPWTGSHPGFNYGLGLDGQYAEERVTFVPDPLLLTTQRRTGPRPVGAAGLAQRIRSDPTFETTVPVDVTIGGAQGLYMDLALAPGATVYRDEDGRTSVLGPMSLHPYSGAMTWGALIDPDSRMRLYLVDLPEGSVYRMLAIAIGAPSSSFEQVLEAAAPIVDSIEFRTP